MHSGVCSSLVLISKIGGICTADSDSVARNICREVGRRAYVTGNDYIQDVFIDQEERMNNELV